MNYLLVLYYTHLITYYTSSLFYYFRERKRDISNLQNKHITYLINVFYKHIIFLCLLYSFIKLAEIYLPKNYKWLLL